MVDLLALALALIALTTAVAALRVSVRLRRRTESAVTEAQKATNKLIETLGGDQRIDREWAQLADR